MLVTRDFVLIHVPKTGGTFLNGLIKEHCEVLHEDMHGPYSRLPAEYRDLPAIGFVRNPWDWYVSWFEHMKQKGPESKDEWEWTTFGSGDRDLPRVPGPGIRPAPQIRLLLGASQRRSRRLPARTLRTPERVVRAFPDPAPDPQSRTCEGCAGSAGVKCRKTPPLRPILRATLGSTHLAVMERPDVWVRVRTTDRDSVCAGDGSRGN